MAKTASTENLKNRLIAGEGSAPAAPPAAVSPYRKVEAYLKRLEPQITSALPRTGITVERLNRIALNTIKQNATLLEAVATQHGMETFLGSIMQAAALGLEPNMLGSCYLVPFREKNKGITVSFQIGYRGYIDLVTRSGEVLYIDAAPVYKGDIFRASKGTKNELYHEQTWESDEESADITHFYAYAKLKNGETVFRVMSVKAINKIRDRHSKSYQYQQGGSIWAQHYEAMGMKTVIKQLVKMLPISVDLAEKLVQDEVVRKDITEPPQFVDQNNIIEADYAPEAEQQEHQPEQEIITE